MAPEKCNQFRAGDAGAHVPPEQVSTEAPFTPLSL